MKPTTQPGQNTVLQEALSLHRSGQPAEAATLYRKLIKQFPKDLSALRELGILELEQGNFHESVRLLQLSLQIDPKQPDALSSLGSAFQALGQLDQAMACFDRAIALRPDNADTYSNRGLALQGLNRLEEALASYDQAIALDPDNIVTYNNRGLTLDSLKRPAEALESYDRAISLNPDIAAIHNNRGNALLALDRPDEALASFDRAIALQPDFAEVHNSLGDLLYRANRSDEALANFNRAIALRPDYAEANENKGVVLLSLNRLDEALASFDRAIALKPEYATAYLYKAFLKLLAGDFGEGWKLYEWRWKDKQLKNHARNFTQPLWLGDQPVAGKTILIHTEQGLGDFIQFCRYAPMVAAMGARVLLETPVPLISLAATLKGNITIINYGEPPPPFDLHCPILSLPLAFKTTVQSTPSEVPYLHADLERQKSWHLRLGSKTKPRIGLVWSSTSTKPSLLKRNVPLQLMKPLLQLPAEFHALQKDIRLADKALLSGLFSKFRRIHLHNEQLYDLSNTAALIQEMDLVISIDTSVAHLAGALGKQVWILLPYAPHFTWMLERTDSPWYPTATLFRQPAPDDWESVITKVVAKLKEII
jgi:tetratricopeptide (TPR) repeat protein